MHGGYGPCGAPGAWGEGRSRREQHSSMAPTHSACAGTALRNSAAAAAVQDLGRHGRAPHRRVMKILLIASGGERSKLGVAPQNYACWWLCIVEKTNDDEQDPGFEWGM